MNRRRFLAILAALPILPRLLREKLMPAPQKPPEDIYFHGLRIKWSDELAEQKFEDELDTVLRTSKGWYSLRHKRYLPQSPRAPRCVLENIE